MIKIMAGILSMLFMAGISIGSIYWMCVSIKKLSLKNIRKSPSLRWYLIIALLLLIKMTMVWVDFKKGKDTDETRIFHSLFQQNEAPDLEGL